MGKSKPKKSNPAKKPMGNPKPEQPSYGKPAKKGGSKGK